MVPDVPMHFIPRPEESFLWGKAELFAGDGLVIKDDAVLVPTLVRNESTNKKIHRKYSFA
jgi:hypothetical protein